MSCPSGGGRSELPGEPDAIEVIDVPVIATGRRAELAPGTRVAGFVPGFDRAYGTYAERLVVPAADVAR